jgi:hypothetical protein
VTRTHLHAPGRRKLGDTPRRDASARISRSTLQWATRTPLTVKLMPDLADAVDAVCTRRPWSRSSRRGLPGPTVDASSRRGRCSGESWPASVRYRQIGSPRTLPVGSDVGDQRGDGRPSSAAKRADAVFRIAFAGRSSLTSRSSSSSRTRSLVGSPGRSPSSTRADLTSCATGGR